MSDELQEGYNSPDNMANQNSDDGFGSEDDFDGQPEMPQPPSGVMGVAANALAGGIANAMEDDAVDELTALENELGEVAGEAQ